MTQRRPTSGATDEGFRSPVLVENTGGPKLPPVAPKSGCVVSSGFRLHDADISATQPLVIKSDSTTAVLVTVDAVAIGEIGHIKNDYLPKVRTPGAGATGEGLRSPVFFEFTGGSKPPPVAPER